MGPTAGSSGLALIVGISEGTLGGLVGVQAFFAAADHVAVWGAPVKSMKLFGYPADTRTFPRTRIYIY